MLAHQLDLFGLPAKTPDNNQENESIVPDNKKEETNSTLTRSSETSVVIIKPSTGTDVFITAGDYKKETTEDNASQPAVPVIITENNEEIKETESYNDLSEAENSAVNTEDDSIAPYLMEYEGDEEILIDYSDNDVTYFFNDNSVESQEQEELASESPDNIVPLENIEPVIDAKPELVGDPTAVMAALDTEIPTLDLPDSASKKEDSDISIVIDEVVELELPGENSQDLANDEIIVTPESGNTLITEEVAPNAVSTATDESEELNYRGKKTIASLEETEAGLKIPPDEELKKRQYYNMRETAKMFDVNQSLLRYWESEFNVLQPKKNKKGDRYFRPIDIKNLALIYHLLKVRKFTIEGAKEYLQSNKKALDNHQLIQQLEKLKGFLLELKNTL
ncbi:MerR family transcriptional regulator [Polluticaenibacter yanchengensis]|uniref:MerR family transcriptional regulator n=1 Tax=Polluticaenibacter yanchengensis TaxID=3014562 RepID=A0ABT4UGN5_9BACT|nr:MerR family transcriptional regulator [Chitinophagaceae bacterium LY-5]